MTVDDVTDSKISQLITVKVFYKDFYIIRSGAEGYDYTGVRVWPGAELLAYYIVSISKLIAQYDVIELGCGVGLTGLLVSNFVRSAYLTDREQVALNLLDHAIAVNGFKAITAKLEWGLQQAKELLANSCNGFETVFGADIVYPDTSDETLDALFETVNVLLKPDDTVLDATLLHGLASAASLPPGCFVCSYVPRSELTTQRFLRTAYKKEWNCIHVPTPSFVDDEDRTSQINAGLLLIFRRMSNGDHIQVPWIENPIFRNLLYEQISEEPSDTEETWLPLNYSVDSDENTIPG
jgi:hypothetical protein